MEWRCLVLEKEEGHHTCAVQTSYLHHLLQTMSCTVRSFSLLSMQFGFRDRKTKKNDPASELMEISHKLRAWIQDDTSAIPNNQISCLPSTNSIGTLFFRHASKVPLHSRNCTWLQLANGIYFSWLLWYNSSMALLYISNNIHSLGTLASGASSQVHSCSHLIFATFFCIVGFQVTQSQIYNKTKLRVRKHA